MEDAFCALNQYFQPDASYRKPDVLLNLRKQAVGKDHVGCILRFGNHQDINVSAGCFDDIDYVMVEKFCVDPVRPERANLAVEIECGEGFDQRLACGDFLRRSAAIFQVENHFIRFASRSLRHHFERMRGTRELTAPNGNGVTAIYWNCHRSPSIAPAHMTIIVRPEIL